MSRKTSPVRRAAFLQAVAETGNQTIAAERAKVSRSWVQLHRSTDPAFDAKVRAALRQAQDRLGGHGARKPPSGWGHLDGEELVVKGTGGSGGGKRVQIARARVKQWTPRVEDRFLATLAATCNVKAACAEVGMTAASAYGHRQRWPAFGRRWEAAVEEGMVRLEAALIETACNLFSAPDQPPEVAMPQVRFQDAMMLLAMRRKAASGFGRPPGRQRRRVTPEELRDRIVRKLKAIVRAEGLDAAEQKKARREWALRGRRRGQSV
jgi:hypothetical protein